MKLVRKENRDGSGQVLLGKVILQERPSRKRDRRADWVFSLEMLRLREIEAIIKHRHGNGIPDACGSDDLDTCMAYLKAVAATPNTQDVASWAKIWAPWADPATVEVLATRMANRKRMLGADAVAKLLFVSHAERTELGLKTIGACDVPHEERTKIAKEGKRARDRSRQEQKRRAEGRMPRTSYEAASTAVTKPWEDEGVSRRTWYRRRGTSLSRVEVIGNGDTPVPPPIFPKSEQQASRQTRVAGLHAGLGDHPPAELQEAAPHGNRDRGGRAA